MFVIGHLKEDQWQTASERRSGWMHWHRTIWSPKTALALRHSRRRRDIVPDARSRGSRILLFASGEPRNPERAHDRMIVEVRRQTLPDGRGSEWALALQTLAEPRPAGSGQLLNPARSNRSSKTSERWKTVVERRSVSSSSWRTWMRTNARNWSTDMPIPSPPPSLYIPT